MAGRGGFTLIEIIMIILIASLAIPALLILMGKEAEYGVDAELRITAANLGQAKMEGIISKGFANIPQGSTGGSEVLGGLTYTIANTVCYVPQASPDDTSACSTATYYKRISVSVSAPNLSGNVEFVGLAADY
jgi:type II secretory pathway pseudopilin PulG